uniref:limulus clotting factor C n=1 Tax=Oncocephalus sp. TaxID=2944721 RepID=A0AB38ZET7_9HEMI
MIKHIALLALVVFANATKHFYDLKVTTGDEVKLRPEIEDGPAESKWKFEACEGCKIVLSCVILSRSCDDHLLTIHDGKSYHYICGPETRFILKNSIYNKMTVTIETKGLRSGSYCRIAVTKPYTNMKYEIIDSSEHGSGIGATKQPSCKCGWTNKSPRRIVGGKITEINEFPFMVLLKISRKKLRTCGASIISPDVVLTAAHCTFPFAGLKMYVGIGEHDVDRKDLAPFARDIEVDKVIDHPDYSDKTNTNDIALLILKESIKFNNAIGPVCLPNLQRDLQDVYATFPGWGNTRTNGSSSPQLRKVHVKIIDLDVCKTIFNIDTVKRNQLCTWAPNRDSCQGDSGGPLLWNDPETKRLTQVGLVSYGRECASTDAAVNTDVAAFMDWIRETLNKHHPQTELCTS